MTQAQEAAAYRKGKIRDKLDKLQEHVTMLRVVEFGTGFVVSGLLGVLKAAKPEWEEAFYGLILDGSTLGLGGVFFVLAGEKKSGDYMREVGGGMIGAGGYSLAQKGGRKVYELIAGG